jgi:hypothetical protein
MLILRNPDVNTDGGSSTPSTPESETSVEVVKDNATESTTAATTDVQPVDFEAAVKAGFEASSAEKKTEEVEKTEEEPEVKEEAKVEDKGPIPYERFAEVNKAKAEAEQTLEGLKPAVDAYNSIAEFCSTNGIEPQDFQYWLNVAAMVKNDPEKAMELLNPKVQELQGFKGEILSPELSAAVENGEMSLEWAKKLAAAENRQKFSAKQTQQTQAQIAQQQEQRFMKEVHTAFDNWSTTKMQSDPDFKPKSDPNGKDGIFELVLYKIGAEWQKAGIKTPQDLTAFAEKCYGAIKGTINSFAAPKKNGVIVRSNQSTTSGRSEPKSLEDAIARGFNRAGIG